MKVLHLADLHLGVENYGRLDPATGLNSRLADFLRCLDFALDHAIWAGVELVVIAGDIYRNREPNPTVQREFAERIQRLVREHIPVVMVVGNHDLPSMSAKATSVSVFSTLSILAVIKPSPCSVL